MDKPTRKLELSKETLRTLNDDEMVAVVGGDRSVVCLDSTICHSGVCGSAAVCQSAVCDSAVCHSGAVCQTGIICGV